MENYLKLVHFEIGRFVKLYIAFICITIISQITGLIIETKKILKLDGELVQKGTNNYYLVTEISFQEISRTPWFTVPITLFFVGILFYIFFIWYRDWFGKSSFMHRLLMLPTARINIFFAKATALLLMVLGFAALQIVLLVVQKRILEWLIPEGILLDFSVHEISGEGGVINAMITHFMFIPESFINFIVHYGFGIMVIIVLFTTVLLERGFKWLGIAMGIVYISIVIGLLYLPSKMLSLSIIYLDEFFILMSLSLLIILIGSIWLSHFLLNKKISV